MFAVGLVVLVAGIFMIAAAGRAYDVRHRQTSDAVFIFFVCVAVIGGLMMVAALVLGLIIATAPGLFAKRETQRVVVQAKFVEDADGNQRFGEDLPSDFPGKRYLRLILPTSHVIEVRCTPFTYEECEEGSVGFADLQGSRLHSFRKVPDRVPRSYVPSERV